MANSLNDDSKLRFKETNAFGDVETPVFDPVTPAGRKARWALLVSSVITLVCLLSAIVTEHFIKPWRIYQRRYVGILSAQAASQSERSSPFSHEIKQITSVSHGITDRCITCHLGIDDPGMTEAEQPFRQHPGWVFELHPPEKYGCTSCHGGQGLATTKEDAHGHVAHWDIPLIPAGFYEAGCGACHTFTDISGGDLAEYGSRAFERNDCFACHQINGRGRGDGPDLSGVGARGFSPNWHERHLSMRQRSSDETWWLSYGPLEPEEARAIDAYLKELVSAPKLVEAKETVYKNGCLGCHRINGVGGDEGPDLSATGRKNPHKLDFSNVKGEKNLANWHMAHLKEPAKVVPNSQMPAQRLTKEEVELTTFYMLSLRGSEVPVSAWPQDRLKVMKLGSREFTLDGESLYNAFCSSCHGKDGFGMRFGIFDQAFPSVAHPEFLAIASDRYLRETLMQGRPGRKMPGWGTKEAGLSVNEVETLVEFIRSKTPSAPAWKEVSEPEPDLELGARLYSGACASCHGTEGEGAIGPALSDPVFLATADPEFIYHMISVGREDTAMGSQPGLGATEIASVIAHIYERRDTKPLSLPVLPAEKSVRSGERVFRDSCASCHGTRGEGDLAVSLVSTAFLKAASDGHMAAAVKHGRCRPPSGATQNVVAPDVTDQELADAIEYVRKRLARGDMQPPGRIVRGDHRNGGELYSQACAGCHGKNGAGGWAPELSNPEFQGVATDGYLQVAIIRGRSSTGMPAFGSDSVNYRKLTTGEVNDLVRYLRTISSDGRFPRETPEEGRDGEQEG